MSFDWQNATALIVVAAAAGYLAWRGWLAVVLKRTACGGCRGCTAPKVTAPKVTVLQSAGSQGTPTIVTIELIRDRR